MSQKYTLSGSSTNTANRIDRNNEGRGGHQIVQLSDGTEVFAYIDPVAGFWKLAWTTDRSTINIIDGSLIGNSIASVSIAVDASDNIYFAWTTINNATCVAYIKGTGKTWTKSTTTVGSPFGFSNASFAPGVDVLWLNTGGTNAAGIILLCWAGSGDGSSGSSGGAVTYDAGKMLTNVVQSSVLGQASGVGDPWLYYPTGASTGAYVQMESDGFGAASGVVVGSEQNGSANSTVGSWSVSSSGAITTAIIQSNIASPGGNNYQFALRHISSNLWAVVTNNGSSTSGAGYSVMRISSSAVLTAWTAVSATNPSGTTVEPNSSLNSFPNTGWDVIADPTVSGKIWLYSICSSPTNSIARLGISVTSGVVADSAWIVDDTSVGTGTDMDLRCCASVRGTQGDYLIYNNNAGTYAGLGDYTQFNETPTAPTLTSPANGAVQDVSSVAPTFNWIYNDADNDTQGAWAMSVVTDGGATQYLNASNNTLQSTIVWNSGSQHSYTPPVGLLTNGHTYNWSIATQDQFGSQGPFATASTLRTAPSPTISGITPTGTAMVAQPLISYTFTPGTGGDTQSSRRIVVEHGTYGTTPGSGTQDVDTGVVSTASTTYQISVNLQNTISYRAFIQVTESNGLVSAWTYATWTEAFDPPAPAVLTDSYDATNNRTLVSVQCHDNLLTANQASLENGNTTGWPGSTNCTLSADSTQALDGSYSLKALVTVAGSIAFWTTTGTSGQACLPNTDYAFTLQIRGNAQRYVTLQALFYDSSGAQIQSTVSPQGSLIPLNTWTFYQWHARSPANAAYVAIQVNVLNCAISPSPDIFWIDQVGILPVQNLLDTDSSDFEASTGNWISPPSGGNWFNSPGCTSSRDTSFFYEGSASLKLVCDGTNANQGASIQNNLIPISPSTTYTIDAWIYVPANTPAGALGIGVETRTSANGNDVAGPTATTAATGATGGWQHLSASVTGSASAVWLNAGVRTITARAITYWMDAVQIVRGASAPSFFARGWKWHRGGNVGGQSVAVYSSDDGGATWQYVRAAGALSPALPSQLATVYDYEQIPGTTRQYKAIVTAGSTSSTSNIASATSNLGQNFWLKDPLTPANNMIVMVMPPLPHQRPEKLATFLPLGGTTAVISADTLLGHQTKGEGLKIHARSQSEWLSLKTLLDLQRPLLLQSPFGEQWYIRIGSSGTNGSSNHRSYDLQGPDATDPSNMYWLVSVPYVEVQAPSLP